MACTFYIDNGTDMIKCSKLKWNHQRAGGELWFLCKVSRINLSSCFQCAVNELYSNCETREISFTSGTLDT